MSKPEIKATVSTKEEVSDFIDAMFASAGTIRPGEMISFSMQPAAAGKNMQRAGEETGRIQLTSPDNEAERWVAAYCKEEDYDEDDPNLCPLCENSPCIWNQEVENIAAFTDPMMESGDYSHRQIRFKVYQYMINKQYGYLGKGVRRELPKCVTDEIHDTWPQSDGTYTGLKQSADDKEED